MKKLIPMLFLVVACATTNTVSKSSSSLPTWVEKIETECPSSEICAIGFNTGLMTAEAAARANIAKYFKTNITSSFNTQTNLNENGSSISQSASYEEGIDELANEVLNGIVIKQRFEAQDGFYVLAALSKPMSRKIYSAKLDTIDQEISSLLQNDTLSSLAKIKMMLEKRVDVEEKFLLVSNLHKSPPISLENVNLKLAKLISGCKVQIEKKGDISDSMLSALKKEFSAFGYTVLSDGRVASDQTHDVLVSALVSKAHLNVKGFESYNFEVVIEGNKSGGSAKSVIKFEAKLTARNLTQATEMANRYFTDFLKNNIANLNLSNR